MNGWELFLGFTFGVIVASFAWDLALRVLRARLAASVELTQDERIVLFANLAGPVARKDGVLDRGELRSIYFKLLGERDHESPSG